MTESHNTTHALFEKALTMLALITLAFNIAGWMKKREFKYFGETAMFITVGLVTSLSVRVVYSIVQAEPILKDVQMSTNFFSMVLLPPIIFEGGYGVHRMLFFKNIPMILALAFAGGIFSTIVIALIMYLATAVTATPWSLLETLIFGALVSSTDPVSILAMLPKETDRSLYITIFGESALNDAVAIILYRFFCGLAAADHGRLTFGLFLLSVLQSVWVFVGSFTVGIGLAFLFAKLTKHQRLTHDAETVEVIMLLVFAYSSYLLADVLGLTGIISVFFTGIAMAHYAKPNMTSMSVLVAKHILHIFSAMADCFIFMYLGMGLLAFPNAVYSPYMICAALVALAAGRTHVFFICGAQNLITYTTRRTGPAKPVPWGHQVFLWFAGLRGAVAFALAVGLLDNESLDETKRSLMFGTAVLVIVITVYGINLLTPFMINKFKIADSSAAQRNAQAGGGAGGSDSDSEEDEGPLPESEIPPGLIGWLYRIDQHHLLPFLTNMNSTSHGRPRGSEGDKHPEGGTYGKVKHGINLADLADDGDVVALQSGAGAIPSSLGSNKPNMSMLGVEKTKDIGAGEKNGNGGQATEMAVLQSARVSKEEVGGGYAAMRQLLRTWTSPESSFTGEPRVCLSVVLLEVLVLCNFPTAALCLCIL